jgi:hypothetical protein
LRLRGSVSFQCGIYIFSFFIHLQTTPIFLPFLAFHCAFNYIRCFFFLLWFVIFSCLHCIFTIINLCGTFVISKFVELFYLSFRLGCCFVGIKTCLPYSASMCKYLWFGRLMVVSFLFCWTLLPASLFFHMLFNQLAKALLARSLFWKMFVLYFLPFWWPSNLCFKFPSLFIWPIHIVIYVYSFHGWPFFIPVIHLVQHEMFFKFGALLWIICWSS